MHRCDTCPVNVTGLRGPNFDVLLRVLVSAVQPRRNGNEKERKLIVVLRTQGVRDKSVSQFSFLRLAPYDENLSDRDFDCIAQMFDSRAGIGYESMT